MIGSIECVIPNAVIGLVQDRTGLLTTLILTCCGASSNEIVSDYAR